MKIRLKCGAAIASKKKNDKYGYSRVYNALQKHLPDYGVDLTEDPKQADVQVTYMQPIRNWRAMHWWIRDRHSNEILYSTWETTHTPKGWAEVINKLYKAIATPSRWCTEVFQNCGVNLPGYVIPHGVDAEQFPYFERNMESHESKWWPGKKTVVLWQGMEREDRKGRCYMDAAYKILRDKYPDLWLVEKIYPMGSREIPDIIDDIYNNRTYIARFMPRDEYLELLSNVHLFIYPTRGEAFGLMPAETLCTGLPTATTNFSGITEYFDERYLTKIQHDMSAPGDDFFSGSPYMDFYVSASQDAVPRVDSIVNIVEDFYHNRQKYFEQAKAGQEWVRKEWTWEKAALALKEMCEEKCSKI